MTAGTKGAARERQVAGLLTAHGWVVYRAAGSHGNADLVALRCDGPPMLVQVKASSAGPFEHFRPTERQALYAEAKRAGAVAVLAHWAPRKPLRWYVGPKWEPGDWDDIRRAA